MRADLKKRVGEFYDQVGWQKVDSDHYQNARFEDLRPVSREYIHRCHMRVRQYLPPGGRYLLDSGSGPIQYPEYLTYSKDYDYRVCLDISIVALKEARDRIGDHGLYVVGDAARLPFAPRVFDGAVSLHTFHHLPRSEQKVAYHELYRVIEEGGAAVVVNGWRSSPLMRLFDPLIKGLKWSYILYCRLRGREAPAPGAELVEKEEQSWGTYVEKADAAWLENELGGEIPMQIRTWRSLKTGFLRALIYPKLGGRWILRMIFWLEDRFPHFFGRFGQYPLIVVQRPTGDETGAIRASRGEPRLGRGE
jgi:hypothetical protein